MGWSRKRTSKARKTSYTAYYRDLRGRTCVAGTFASLKAAEKAWQAAEVKLAEGRLGDPRRGRKLFRTYACDEWLPHHVMEATTRETYTYELNRHILTWFGDLRMADILPGHVREWVPSLQEASLSPASIAKLRFILSSIFTTALNERVVNLHPCKGVKTPTIAKRPLQIISPEQFDLLYSGLPDAEMQLLVETDIETGMRWGELTELRGKDLDCRRRAFTIARAVVQVNPKFHPQGERFLVKDYPKDGEHRRVKIGTQLVDKIAAHVHAERLGPDDLLFQLRDHRSNVTSRPAARPDPDEPGFTDPNEKGRTYRHGTLSAYNTGRCRCRECKDAYATYRLQRRGAGKDRSDRSPFARTPRPVDTDGHIPRDWFRNQVWTPARNSAALPFPVRVHDLRHAHASWLVAGGADLQAVKERLGHGSIRTTERYPHTLEDSDEATVDAFENIRYRSAVARRNG